MPPSLHLACLSSTLKTHRCGILFALCMRMASNEKKNGGQGNSAAAGGSKKGHGSQSNKSQGSGGKKGTEGHGGGQGTSSGN
jgi:hypothetical protein